MKKILFSLLMAGACLFISPVTSNAQTGTGDYEGYLGALDTLTNADTATYIATVTGPKHNVSFSVNITKLTGTLAGKINLYGSVDGTNYLTTALATEITITDASQVRGFSLNYNGYKKYKLVVITSGTNTSSHRASIMYRKQP